MAFPRGDLGLSEEQLGAWRAFLRAYDHVLRRLDVDLREAHDLTIAEYDVLVQLSMAEGRRLRMRDLARAILLEPERADSGCASASRPRGWSPARPSAGDQRGTDAVLTRAGAARLREASPTHLQGVHDRFAAHLSDRQLRELGQRSVASVTAGSCSVTPVFAPAS